MKSNSYIFTDEPLEYLISTGLHCIHEDYVEYLTGMNIENITQTKPTKRNYKIGIIIPNCNYSEWLDKCLGSIEHQTYRNFEVVFVDDCSTDNSIEIAKTYQDKMDMKIVRLKQKRYNGGARNEGYLYLSDDVDYVWYIDSDDWITNNALELINDNLQGSPDVLFVGLKVEQNGIERGYYVQRYYNRYEAIEGWSGSSGKVIKKELATSQLYQEGTLKEDRTQHYKICLNMKSFKCLDEMIYIWNKNNTKSVTTERNAKWKSDTIRNYADAVEMYELYKGKDIKMDKILMNRVVNCKNEIDTKKDGQQ